MSCKHGLESGCALCKARHQPPVFMSKGGDVYHRHPRCTAYLVGRRKADGRLGSVHDLEEVSRLEALARQRRPCLVCWSYGHGRAAS